ncbi:MAG: beta/gamma crystallin-related protein [Janthinobacterium lividum]
MSRALTNLAVTLAVAFAAATSVGAQVNYGDPRNTAPQGDPRYGDQQGDPRGGPQGDPRYGDPRDGDRRDGDRRGPGSASATFYSDDRFGGRSVTLDHGVRRLGEIGMEDKISSIQVNSGRWLVCQDDDFRGRCITIDHSVGRLSRMGMDDKISSVRPIRDGDDRGRGDERGRY